MMQAIANRGRSLLSVAALFCFALCYSATAVLNTIFAVIVTSSHSNNMRYTFKANSTV